MAISVRVPLIVAGLVLACASPALGQSRLSGEWKLDEGAGSIVNDSAGANHGVIVTEDGQRPAWIPGVQGNGLRFSGKGSVRLPDAAIFESPELSVEAWVRRTGSPGAFRYVLSKGGSACETSSYGLYTGPGGGISFYVLGSGGYVRSPEQVPAKVWDGNWHQVVGAYVPGDGVHLYVDGAEVGTGRAGPDRIVYGLPSKSPFLGAYGGSCALPYDGDLDLVRLYTVALTAQSLTQAVQTPGARPSLPSGGSTTTSARCLSVTSGKVKLRRGRKATVTVTIRRSGATVAKRRVQLSGGGLKARTRKTDKRGRVKFVIRPKRASSVRVLPMGQGKGCKRTTLRVAAK